jgi:hypothetical protein
MNAASTFAGISATLCAFIALAVEPGSTPRADADAIAFDRLRSLAGEWQGEAGEGTQKFPMTLRYEIASGGKSVIERLFPGTDHEMVTVYFLASGRLRATHYCSMGNQPSYRFVPDPTGETLAFAFDGGTGFDPARDTHVHEGLIRFPEPGALEGAWIVWSAGKAAGVNRWRLTRK